MEGKVARTVPVSGSAVWFRAGFGSAGRFALPAVGRGKVAGEVARTVPVSGSGGLVSGGLRLSGTLRPTGGWGRGKVSGMVARTVPVSVGPEMSLLRIPRFLMACG